MPQLLWRIAVDTPDYTADDLSGRGAERTGGRWNAKGSAMLYTSESIALACLETLVHLTGGDPLPLNRYLVSITVPDVAWMARTIFDRSTPGWDAQPSRIVFGTEAIDVPVQITLFSAAGSATIVGTGNGRYEVH